MMRVEWTDNAGSFDSDAIPESESYFYREHTDRLYVLEGTVMDGTFAGDELLLKLLGHDFTYDSRGNGELRLDGGALDNMRFVVDGRLILDVAFSPSPDAGTVFDRFAAIVDRGFDYRGNRFDNRLEGGEGGDGIRGREGADHLLGWGGRDSLEGGPGADTLDGGGGGDRLSGGDGDDLYIAQNPRDEIVEQARKGVDTVRSSIDFTLGENVENLTLTGQRDSLGYGNGQSNVIDGNEGDNLLVGGAGRDSLSGGDGADRLRGGEGVDLLSGGEGADIFIWRSLAEAGVGPRADRIADITSGLDLISLSRIDANSSVAGNQAFVFIGGADFSGVAGELRYADGLILGDIDGDALEDLGILCSGTSGLVASDFLL